MSMRGFTLLEMIVAVAILGIISSMVAIFISRPIEGYVDAANRAELTDAADLALKRMALEIRTAVPNSVRVGAGYVEFIPARGGGRYCSDTEACTNQLTHFASPNGASGSATISFDVLGPTPAVSNGDQIIIYNTGQTGLNAYSNDNCATVTGGTTTLQFTDTPFPFASPSKRFFIAPSGGAVRFTCSATQLTRVSGIDYCGLTPADTSALLIQATNLNCNFQYDQVSAANALLTMTLTVGNAGGNVTLMNQIHVDNMP